MKRGILLLPLLAMLLVSCTGDLPRTPPPPGVALGMFGAAIGGAAYANPEGKFNINPQEFFLDRGEEQEIEAWVFNQDLVYNTGYVWTAGRWQSFEYEGGEKIPGTDWLRNGAFTRQTVGLGQFEEGVHYMLAYGCSKTRGGWDCNGGKWMPRKFIVRSKASLPVGPAGPPSTVESYPDYLIEEDIGRSRYDQSEYQVEKDPDIGDGGPELAKVEFSILRHSLTIKEHEDKTYNMDGIIDYHIEALVVSESSGSAKFRVNGEITDEIYEGEFDVLSDGTVFALTGLKGDVAEIHLSQHKGVIKAHQRLIFGTGPGPDYEVEALLISADGKVKLKINGEVTEDLAENEVDTLSDGADVAILEIYPPQ